LLGDLQEVDFRGAINIEYAFVDQTQRAILGLTDDTVTQLQQQITQAEQAIRFTSFNSIFKGASCSASAVFSFNFSFNLSIWVCLSSWFRVLFSNCCIFPFN
jgi:hypothetical protein